MPLYEVDYTITKYEYGMSLMDADDPEDAEFRMTRQLREDPEVATIEIEMIKEIKS